MNALEARLLEQLQKLLPGMCKLHALDLPPPSDDEIGEAVQASHASPSQ